MTPEELELLKKLLEKAREEITKKHQKYFHVDRDIYETESSYALWLDVRHLEIKLNLGAYDEYLLNQTEQKQ